MSKDEVINLKKYVEDNFVLKSDFELLKKEFEDFKLSNGLNQSINNVVAQGSSIASGKAEEEEIIFSTVTYEGEGVEGTIELSATTKCLIKKDTRALSQNLLVCYNGGVIVELEREGVKKGLVVLDKELKIDLAGSEGYNKSREVLVTKNIDIKLQKNDKLIFKKIKPILSSINSIVEFKIKTYDTSDSIKK